MLEDRGSATLEAGDEAEDPAVDQRRDPTNRGGGDRGGNRAFPPRVNGSFFPFLYRVTVIAFDLNCVTCNARLG